MLAALCLPSSAGALTSRSGVRTRGGGQLRLMAGRQVATVSLADMPCMCQPDAALTAAQFATETFGETVGVLLLNGHRADPETRVRPGDTVELLPAEGGDASRRGGTARMGMWRGQPACAAAGLGLLAIPCDVSLAAAPPLIAGGQAESPMAVTTVLAQLLATDGAFGIVVSLLVLAVASGALIQLDASGSSAGNESPLRNRDAAAATAAAVATAAAAAALAVLAARVY